MDTKRLVRTKEAAKYLSISNWKLRSLAYGGQIPIVQAGEGSPLLFDVRDLDAWVEGRKHTL